MIIEKLSLVFTDGNAASKTFVFVKTIGMNVLNIRCSNIDDNYDGQLYTLLGLLNPSESL